MSSAQAAIYPAEFRRIRLAPASEPGRAPDTNSVSFEFIAPLDGEGRIDPAQWRSHRHLCRAVRFREGETEEIGHLVRRPGGSWAFHYDLAGEDDDDAARHFERHVFKVGEYVSIDDDSATRTYRVAAVSRP